MRVTGLQGQVAAHLDFYGGAMWSTLKTAVHNRTC